MSNRVFILLLSVLIVVAGLFGWWWGENHPTPEPDPCVVVVKGDS